MIDDNSQNNSGQSEMDSETERRNRENETGQQSPSTSAESGQSQADQAHGGQAQGGQSEFGQAQDGQAGGPGQTGGQAGQDSGQAQSGQVQFGQPQSAQSGGESGSGFVGSAGDQSSDYLTHGENQDFQPEGQGASDTDAGTSDITTGQPTSSDSTLDDGSDTSH